MNEKDLISWKAYVARYHKQDLFPFEAMKYILSINPCFLCVMI